MNSRTAAQVAALSARLDRLTDGLSDLEDEFEVTVERYVATWWKPLDSGLNVSEPSATERLPSAWSFPIRQDTKRGSRTGGWRWSSSILG